MYFSLVGDRGLESGGIAKHLNSPTRRSSQIPVISFPRVPRLSNIAASKDHFLLVQALKRVGMTMKDIQFVPMETSKAADAFATGKVDATVVFAPFTTKALKRPGSRVLFSSKYFLGSISDHLVFTRKFVDKHPEKVQAVVDSWFTTLNHINKGKNKDEADLIMAKRAGVTMSEYKNYLDGTKIFSTEDNIEAFKQGKDNIYLSQAAVEASQFLFENKLIKTKVDVSKIFDDYLR